MVMPRVPLVLLAYGAVAGGGGVVAGTVGGIKIKRAESQKKGDRARYDNRHAAHLEEHEQTNAALRLFGEAHEKAQHEVVHRMRDLLERLGKQVLMREYRIVDGVDFSAALQVLAAPRLNLDVEGWAQGVLRSALAGGTAWSALHEGVKEFASASTGTPLSKLHGAAAERARRAFLGGGSLASGGGGMALGAKAENAAVAGSVVLVAGLTAMQQGAKKRTEADEYRTAVDIVIAELDFRGELFRGVRERAREKHDVLTLLAAKATSHLDSLSPDGFDMAIHGERLHAALTLVKSVQQIAAAPIADEDGNLDPDTEKLIFKYRGDGEEKPDA